MNIHKVLLDKKILSTLNDRYLQIIEYVLNILCNYKCITKIFDIYIFDIMTFVTSNQPFLHPLHFANVTHHD